MKKALTLLGGLALLGMVLVVVMALVQFCPPQGPWPQPPWCPGSPFAWPFSEAVPTIQAEEERTDIIHTTSDEEAVAEMAKDVFAGLSRVQSYFDQGIRDMGQSTPELDVAIPMGALDDLLVGARLACMKPLQGRGPANIPTGFTSPLGPSGFIDAPSGGCGAGASPSGRFNDVGGQPVTGERLAEEDVATIDFATLTGAEPEDPSLESLISEALQPGDMRLTTAEGWNEVLWEPLSEQQQPMDSLIDYQLWNTADEIETLIVESIEDRMQTMGIPEIVVEAFRQSEHHGWFASRPSAPENELASMDIIAEFDGDFSGTIEEERTFTLPPPGEMPEFGPMTGGGVLTFDHPTLGELIFDVELEWTDWDELGRVNGGEMNMVEQDGGYEIHMIFLPDGTKEGEVFMNGELVGTVEMIVEGNDTLMEFFPLE